MNEPICSYTVTRVLTHKTSKRTDWAAVSGVATDVQITSESNATWEVPGYLYNAVGEKLMVVQYQLYEPPISPDYPFAIRSERRRICPLQSTCFVVSGG